MPEQRVSDERLVRLTRPGNVVELLLEEAREFHNVWRELALDLRDARNELARLNGQTQYDLSGERLALVEPVVKAALHACKRRRPIDLRAARAALTDLQAAVDALPEGVRLYYGTPPIDWDAPADPPAPAKDGAE